MINRPKMTATEATQFDSYSPNNAALVAASLSCGCEPYEDVFTFARWKAQGYHVRRGEHGIRLAAMKTISRENPETGEMEKRKMFGKTVVFCRCQVSKDRDQMGDPAQHIGDYPRP